MALVLTSFVVLTALALQHSVHSRAEQAQRDRMEGLVYGILGATELTSDGELLINDYSLPDGRLRQPQSGLSARIFDHTNTEIWHSESQQKLLKNRSRVAIGKWHFVQQENVNEIIHFTLRFGFSWSNLDGEEKQFNILLLANADEHIQQLDIFDRNLLATLAGSALLLLLLQLLVLMWGLRPLNKISQGLSRIRDGHDDSIDTDLPKELKPVAKSLNELLQSERKRQKQYRNVIDDLAHSLKTPLSIMQNLSEDDAIDSAKQHTLAEQSGRMKDIIAYHIRRASISGSKTLHLSIQLKPLTERLAVTLNKVYAGRNIVFENHLPENCTLRMDEADAMEIFGNIMENACKYKATRIKISRETFADNQQYCFVIEDNGPGFPAESQSKLLERGTRADTRVEGQGIGLAITSELVESYGGELKLGKSEALSGASLRLYFSATI